MSPAPAPPMELVPASGGISFAVHDHSGDASGRPLLLCHATGLHAAVWEPLSAALPDRLRRWALDFRAHGASVVPPGTELPWVDMRDDVLTVIDHLAGRAGGLDGLVGVGHSMGGAALL